METYHGKSTQVMEQRCQKGTEGGSIFAMESQLVDPMDDGGVVPRPISSHRGTLLPEQEAAENGDKSSIQNEIKPGYLYEIDHIHLPSRTPAQLRSIRVAMVCEKTEMDVAVRYPSMESLRAFFNYSTRETHPALDKKFVMGMASATRVLARLVPAEDFSAQKSVEAFWMISSSASESFGNKVNVTHKKGICLSELKGNGMLRWGVRRQVKYLGRHKESEGNHGVAQNSSSSFVDGFEESHMEHGGICRERESIERERINGGSDVAGFNVIGVDGDKENEEEGGEEDEGNGDDDQENEGDEEEEEGEEEGEEQEEEEEEEKVKSNKNLKRKTYSFRNNGAKKPKKEKVEIKKNPKQKKSTTKKSKGRFRFKETLALRDPKDRWSAERYKLAEENLLSVMQAKCATVRKPILRPQLRAEARKRIGDTGLLDHLLKHMAGKLAPGGECRFRRRHNPDGAMEYWLESADLVNIRKEAGVNDPYWVPPLGWKPGDPPTQDPTCARELKLLKDDISQIKRDLELMVTKVQLEEEIEKLRRELEEIASKKRKELNQAISIASSQSDHSQKLDQQVASSWTSSKIDFHHASVSVENCKKQLMTISDVLKEIEERIEKMRPNMEQIATTKDSSLMKPTEEHTKSKQQEVQALIAAREETSKLGKDQTTAQTEASPKAAAAAAEEKAAKIQRLKSGFRICKPQGTFLWPNMVKDKNTSNNSSSGKLMSPQVGVQVEVPTPPSVSSSTAAAPPQLPYPQPYHHHPVSLVKPLAEKRAVTISSVSEFQNKEPSAAALINLVNAPTNANVMPLVTHLSPNANTEPWQNTAYGLRNARDNDPKECNTITSSATSFPSEVGNWLALSTLKSASDESNHG